MLGSFLHVKPPWSVKASQSALIIIPNLSFFLPSDPDLEATTLPRFCHSHGIIVPMLILPSLEKKNVDSTVTRNLLHMAGSTTHIFIPPSPSDPPVHFLLSIYYDPDPNIFSLSLSQRRSPERAACGSGELAAAGELPGGGGAPREELRRPYP